MSTKQKVAVITGASQGIGAALITSHVLLVENDSQLAQLIAQELGCEEYGCVAKILK